MDKLKMHSPGVPMTLDDLREVGKKAGVNFPSDYEMFAVLGFAGGQPDPNIFNISQKLGDATVVQFVDPREIVGMIENAPHLYGEDLVPIAQEGTGDKLCLSKHEGGIVYVAHEHLDDPDLARTKIADSWCDFIDGLKPYSVD
jgi:hypothetical protein